MKDFARIILETHLDDNFARVLYESLAIFEATNINKAFLLKEAGSPEALKEAKDRVNNAWNAAQMNGIVKGNNLLQKLFNFLYLMEIRKPGFTSEDILHKIHDLAIHGSLEQRFLSKVTSDTVPEEAAVMLDDANAGAVQAAKPYPDLTKEEEAIWNRVKVYHEFPDGFKWVYAVDSSGRIAPNIPSSITGKTMHHCGNSPRAGSDDQYWELRDANGKAYLTVILTPSGQIEESKSWGNQENKYRKQIQPYVKWFLKDQKVTGVGHRYDYGYASQMNFGVKDFIGDDPEFIDYVIENKSELLGNTEARILFWQDAIKEGVLTVEDLKNAYVEHTTVSQLMDKVPQLKDYADRARFHIASDRFSNENSIFGSNPFVVICAACSGNPFTPDEIEKLVKDGTLSLEEFANYDVHLLTPEIQKVFVRANSRNFDTLSSIAEQVASFTLTPELWMGLLPGDDEPVSEDMIQRSMKILDYVFSANPPSKVKTEAETMMSNDKFIDLMVELLRNTTSNNRDKYGWYVPSRTKLIWKLSGVLEKFPEMPIPEKLLECLCQVLKDWDGSGDLQILLDIERIGSPRNEPLLAVYTDDRIAREFFDFSEAKRRIVDYAQLKEQVYTLIKMFGKDRISRIIARFPDFTLLQGTLINLVGSDNDITDSMIDMIKQCINDWTVSDWHGNVTESNAAGMLSSDLLVNHPATLDALDWNEASTYAGLANVARQLGRGMYAETGVTADKVKTFVDRVCDEALEHNDVSWKEWDSGGNVLCGALSCLMGDYSVKSESAERLYRYMGDLMLGNFGKTTMRYKTSWFSIPGAWRIFTIPYDAWEEYYERYGFRFVVAYVLRAPSDRFIEDGFIVNFVCKKLQDNVSEEDVAIFCNVLGNYDYRAIKAKIASTISDAIIAGEFNVSESIFMKLYSERFINAKAYRAYLTRREDKGAMEVNDISTAEGVVKSMRSISKLPTLPQLITSTVQYLLGRMYDNMGDGDGQYYMKVDQQCIHECDILNQLISQMVRKSTTGYIPVAITSLFSSGLVDKMLAFEQANLQACEVPGKPRAKMKCSISGELRELADLLDRVKDSAAAAAAKITDKKPKKRRVAGNPA